MLEKMSSVPLLENGSPLEQEQGSPLPSMLTPTPVSATWPCSSVPQQKQYSGLTPKLSLPLSPAEMVSMRDTGTWRASQSLKKKQRCIYMMNQNPLLGFTANPQVPRTCNFNPGLAPSLILRKGFRDYISTIVLGFPELRKQWEHQTKDIPLNRVARPQPWGFPQASAFTPPVSGKWQNFHRTGPSKMLKRY